MVVPVRVPGAAASANSISGLSATHASHHGTDAEPAVFGSHSLSDWVDVVEGSSNEARHRCLDYIVVVVGGDGVVVVVVVGVGVDIIIQTILNV